MKKIMTREEIIATTKQVVAEKKAEKEAKAEKVEEKATSEKVKEEKPSTKSPTKKAKKVEEKAEKVKPSAKKAEKKAKAKEVKPSEKSPSKDEKKENKVVIKSFKAFKALTDEKQIRVILEWSENDKVHFQTCFGKPLPKCKGSYYEVTNPILVESNNVLLWSDKLKVTHLMLNVDFKNQSLNGIPFTIEVMEG